MPHRIALLVSGASGMLLPRHFLGRLAAHPEVERIEFVVCPAESRKTAPNSIPVARNPFRLTRIVFRVAFFEFRAARIEFRAS
jgi:hypothetical protein